jgi:polysaccharide export outer membrane protein
LQISLLLALVAAAVGCASSCPVIPASERQVFLSVKPEEGGYVISAGDQLDVEVWQQAQLTRQVTVRPDGRITLPLINEETAAGLTVPQFQAQLTKRLEEFVKEPIVSITVRTFTQKRFYVAGQVRSPSAYGYQGDMSLLQALALAGGTTPFSEMCAVLVRRKGDAFVRYDVALEPLVMGDNMKENIAILPNDVITVH